MLMAKAGDLRKNDNFAVGFFAAPVYAGWAIFAIVLITEVNIGDVSPFLSNCVATGAWHVSNLGESCDAACSAAGGSCSASDWPSELTSATFDEALASAVSGDGLSCSYHSSSRSSRNPSIDTSGYCYRRPSSGVSCSTSPSSSYRRLCWCSDVASASIDIGAPAGIGVSTAATHCNSCPAGTFNEQGDISCDSCPSGQFSTVSEATNVSVCSGCAAGQVSTSTRHDGTAVMPIDGEATHIALRLVGDAPGATRGRLEMSVDGRVFRPVCSVGFGSSEAQIFCRALGYDGREAITWNTQKKASRFAAGGISCGEAASIDGCSANTATDMDS